MASLPSRYHVPPLTAGERDLLIEAAVVFSETEMNIQHHRALARAIDKLRNSTNGQRIRVGIPLGHLRSFLKGNRSKRLSTILNRYFRQALVERGLEE